MLKSLRVAVAKYGQGGVPGGKSDDKGRDPNMDAVAAVYGETLQREHRRVGAARTAPSSANDG